MVQHPPRYQLVKGDPFNASLGLCAAFALAAAKSLAESEKVHPVLSWSLCAYTNWNLTFLALRVALDQHQWDPFLLCNSAGVLLGFRTAMAQGIADNMRRKIALLGLPLERWQFELADHVCHSLPPIFLLGALVRRKQRVPALTAIYALVLASWFAFRQQAKLDSSGIYVPHPWRRTWMAIATGMGVMPPLVDALIARRHGRSAALAGLLLLPWLSTYLDPNLRAKYDFEFALSRLEEAKLRGNGATDRGPMRRTASEAPFTAVRS